MGQAILIFLVEHLIMIGLVVPIIIVGMNGKNNYKNIILFCLFFIITNFLNAIPGYFDSLKILTSQWNWNGKIISLLFSIVFIMIFYRLLKDNYFFTIKQKENSIKSTVSVMITILIIISLFMMLSGEKVKLNIETLAFQISLPSLDEEFSYRGIMLGLLAPSISNYFSIYKFKLSNPAIWITAILFGLVHGFNLTIDWQLQINFFSFGYTFALGLIWGWMVLKSGSILIPILSHSSNNFIATLITMLK